MSRALPARKWPAIDVIRLYSRGDAAGWNQMLTEMLVRQDVQGITKTLYGIQAGMADAGKTGVVDDKMAKWFLRAQRSLENTAKKIFRAKYPSPLDRPSPGPSSIEGIGKELAAKRKRDQALEAFLREARF